MTTRHHHHRDESWTKIIGFGLATGLFVWFMLNLAVWAAGLIEG